MSQQNSHRRQILSSFSETRLFLETSTAFANSNGGEIIITQTLPELKKLNLLDELDKLNNKIHNNIKPEIHINSLKIDCDGSNPQVVLSIPQGKKTPYKLAGNCNDKSRKSWQIFIRNGWKNSIVKLQKYRDNGKIWRFESCEFDTWIPASEITDERLLNILSNYDSDNKHRSFIENWQKKALIQNSGKDLKLNLMLASCFDSKIITEHLPFAHIIFHNLMTNETLTIDGNLIDQYRTILQLIFQNVSKGTSINSIYQEDQFAFPTSVVKEAVTNALLHRDYRIDEPVVINIGKTYLEIISPGTLAQSIDFNHGKIVSIRRNPQLYNAWESFYKKMGVSTVKTMQGTVESYNYLEMKVKESRQHLSIRFQQTNLNNIDLEKIASLKIDILTLCTTPQKPKFLQEELKIKNRRNLLYHLIPLVDSGFLEMSHPDKPRSKSQTYKITDLGLEQLEA